MIEKDDGLYFQAERADCARRRLSEGGIAAVDLCSCGILQVHIGALTLRMDEAALAELTATFGRALVNEALRKRSAGGPALPAFQARKPGQA
jgi:hypothetical protein